MASFFDSGCIVSQMTVCHICGDKGDAQLLIICVKCQDFLVHKYCCGKFSPEDDKDTWICEDCAPKVAKVEVGTSRKSERISSKQVRDAEVRLKWIKMLNKKITMAKRQVYTEAGTSKADNSYDQIPFEDLEKPRYLMIEEENLCPEQDRQVESDESKAILLVPYGPCVPLNRSCSESSLESSSHICAQPVKDPVWSGQFSIANAEDEITVGIMAHLSIKACLEVINAAAALPSVLELEVLSKCDVWPKSFKRSPPTDDSIGLYLFPKSERDEKEFDGVLDDMNEDNLALKAKMDNLELLVFTSLELPKQQWRFRRKYYLWGVLVQKHQHSPVLPTIDHTIVQSHSTKLLGPPKQSRM